MLKLIPLAYLFFCITLSSCVTYRNGQTPDDVYMAAEPEFVNDIDLRRYRQTDAFREDLFNHRNNGNLTFRDINNFYCDDPSRFFIMNNQCFCLTNNNIVPFRPARQITNSPNFQNNPTIISREPTNGTINYGKFSAPEYQNGSRYFPKGSNNNNTTYPSSEDNGGSRYFQNNATQGSYRNMNSGGSIRSGRRN